MTDRPAYISTLLERARRRARQLRRRQVILDTDRNTFHEWLRGAYAAGATGAEIAEATGISERHVWRILAAAPRPGLYEALTKINEAYGSARSDHDE